MHCNSDTTSRPRIRPLHLAIGILASSIAFPAIGSAQLLNRSDLLDRVHSQGLGGLPAFTKSPQTANDTYHTVSMRVGDSAIATAASSGGPTASQTFTMAGRIALSASVGSGNLQ